MAVTWTITYKGDIINGFDREAVIAAFMETFSISGDDTAKVFSGAMNILADNMSQIEAQYHLSQFNKIGMYVYIQSMPENATNTTSGPARSGRMVVGADGRLIDAAPKLQKLNVPYSHGEVETKRVREKAPIPPYFAVNMSGRYGRLNFCNAMVLYTLLPMICGITLLMLAVGNMALLYTTMTLVLLSIPFVFRAVTLRLHDIEYSGIWAFVYILLYILQSAVFVYYVRSPEAVEQKVLVTTGYMSMLFYAALLFLPGSGGKNEYGFEVKQGTIIGAAVIMGLAALGIYLYPYR